MGNIFNEDFHDFLEALRRRRVRYVLVGGYSVILHGYGRTTGDLDIWVEKTPGNYQLLAQAFHDFGMPTFDMTADNFLDNPLLDVFTFGRSPVAIDIITRLKGLEFPEAFEQATEVEIEGLTIRLIHYQHLLQAKRAAGPPATKTTWITSWAGTNENRRVSRPRRRRRPAAAAASAHGAKSVEGSP